MGTRTIAIYFSACFALLVLHACAPAPETPLWSNDVQTRDSECVVWFKSADKVIEPQDFTTTGFTNAELPDLERRFGRYLGTFEKVAIFGIRTHKHKKERELTGTAVTKLPSTSLFIEGEFDDGMLYRFKVRQANSAKPFTEMEFKFDFGTAKDRNVPDIRIIKIERDSTLEPQSLK